MAFFKFKTLLKKDKKVSPKIEVENPGLVADTKIARSTKLRNSIRQVTNKLRLTKAIPPGPIGIWYQDRGHNVSSRLESMLPTPLMGIACLGVLSYVVFQFIVHPFHRDRLRQ